MGKSTSFLDAEGMTCTLFAPCLRPMCRPVWCCKCGGPMPEVYSLLIARLCPQVLHYQEWLLVVCSAGERCDRHSPPCAPPDADVCPMLLQCFGPLAFYDVPGRESQPRGSSSLVNKREAEMALALCSRLLERYPHLRTAPAVAVISPYQAQVSPKPNRISVHILWLLFLCLPFHNMSRRKARLRSSQAGGARLGVYIL